MSGDSTSLKQILNAGGDYTTYIEISSGNPLYIGDAEPGSDTSDSIWRIKKMSYDSDGNVISVTWAGGSRAFKFIWDKRGDYTYS